MITKDPKFSGWLRGEVSSCGIHPLGSEAMPVTPTDYNLAPYRYVQPTACWFHSRGGKSTFWGGAGGLCVLGRGRMHEFHI